MSTDHKNMWPGFIAGQTGDFDGAVMASGADAYRFVTTVGLGPSVRDRLLVVVEEIVGNIVTHGAPPPGSLITWRFAAEDGVVRLFFTDAGKHFDPRGTVAALPEGEAARAAAAPERSGGVGWRLVLAWCDIAVCAPDNGTNRLELVMRPQVSAA